MTFSAILTRIRRYLRDPDGLIWTDADIMTMFNDAADEIATRTGLIVKVHAYHYPPQFDYSYLQDWEKVECQGDRWRCLEMNQASGKVITYPWEAAYWYDTAPMADDGYRFTHPLETNYAAPADPVKILLHEKFSKMKFIAWDEDPLEHITEWELARRDGYYRNTTGDPQNYYHPDQAHNQIVIYPRPSIVWDEPDYTDILDDDGGIISSSEDWLDSGDVGMSVDVIDMADQLFMIYETYPVEIVETSDTPDLPAYMVKYAEYGTLERAYGVDSDGFIPSLRDYWKWRKDTGIEIIKKWKRLGLIGRQYRLGGTIQKGYAGRYPKLPSTYDDRW